MMAQFPRLLIVIIKERDDKKGIAMHIPYQRLIEMIENQLSLTAHERQHIDTCSCCRQVLVSFTGNTVLQLDHNLRRLCGC